MRHDDELRTVGEAPEELDEAPDVRVVEGRLDLVEQVEGARPREEEREEERDRAERLLAAREKREPRDPLAGRLELDLDAVLLAPSERAIVDVLFESPGEFAIEHTTPGQSYRLGEITVTDERAEIVRYNANYYDPYSEIIEASDVLVNRPFNVGLRVGRQF